MTRHRDGVAMDVRVGETLRLAVPGAGRDTEITLEVKSGQVARLRINAPGDVKIVRPRKEGAAVG